MARASREVATARSSTQIASVKLREHRTHRSAIRVFGKNPVAVVGALFVVTIVVASLLAPVVSPYDPLVGFDTRRLAPPLTEGHLLGTDGQGRDVLSRILWGGRISLFSAVTPALLALPVALTFGLVAGYFGGWLDQLIMRVFDILLAFPMVLLAIAIGGVLGPGLWTESLAIGIVLTPYMGRVVYNVTRTVKPAEFVEAARAVGGSTWRILVREITPNVVPALVVYVSSILGRIMIVAAGLSFFGLGPPPPTPDWGVMVNEGRLHLAQAPGTCLFPGLMVVLVSLAFNFVGDGLRDVLDPRWHPE